MLVDGTDTKLNLLTRRGGERGQRPVWRRPLLPDAGRPATYDCGDVRPGPHQFVLGQLVGADTFDIGHIGLGVNGGGIAGLGVVGGANKADGLHRPSSTDGDFYAIDYVAHEIGHQMGGNHTFNGTQANCCGGNRNAADTRSSPGSGSSVMAYAGICGQDDLQPHSDPYFSFAQHRRDQRDHCDSPANRRPSSSRQPGRLRRHGDSFTLSCTGCATSGTVTNGTNYTAAAARAGDPCRDRRGRPP